LNLKHNGEIVVVLMYNIMQRKLTHAVTEHELTSAKFLRELNYTGYRM